MEIYVVRPGDNVDQIAARYSVSVEELIYNNQLAYPYRLAIGQALLVQTDPPPEGRRAIVSNGYAYPYIEEEVLKETLPYLSEISVFSYGFTAEGNLIPPQVDDQWIIDQALAAETIPILTLTPLGPDGRFSNQLVSIAVRDMQVQQNLINQVVQTVLNKRFRGVDVDFEYILAEDREAYARFVARLRRLLNMMGIQVSVALAPKTSADQKGLLYEGKDYGLLGQAANQVLLMTYEWGYTYSEPMAVAPINKVRQVVEYALTEIPREKINLGIPNYGYDWPLPYVKGETAATSIGNVEAVQRAIDFGVEIQFDPIAQTPFYRYWQYGILHEVWFEDVRSIQAKLNLVKEYGLLGAGYWQLMRLFRANWKLMESLFTIRKTGPEDLTNIGRP